METEIFTLCDYAQDFHGKLTIVGTFDSINAPALPVQIPNCSVATRLRFANNEAGSHSGYIVFKHRDTPVIPQLNFNLTAAEGPVGYSTSNLVLNIGNLRLNDPGKYTIELYLDGQWKSGLTFNVSRIKPVAA